MNLSLYVLIRVVLIEKKKCNARDLNVVLFKRKFCLNYESLSERCSERSRKCAVHMWFVRCGVMGGVMTRRARICEIVHSRAVARSVGVRLPRCLWVLPMCVACRCRRARDQRARDATRVQTAVPSSVVSASA